MSADTAAGRRIAALRQARTQDAARKHQTVLDTLQQMTGNGVHVTFQVVARRAGVSRQFLYGDATLRAAVQQARRKTPAIPGRDAPADHDGAQTDLLLAREEIKRLRTEHAKLKTKLVEHLASSQLASEEEAVRELTIRNAELVREVTGLHRQLTTAQEDLAAARDTNRDLMTELNRRQPRRE
jgi:hypothetical protein